MGDGRIHVFVSYAHEDRLYLKKFWEHVADLRRDEITVFHDEEIRPGQQWESVILHELDTADIVVLLVSSAFVASSFCYLVEFKRALEREALHQCKIIPVNLKPVDLKADNPLRTLQQIPRDKPISEMRSRESAWKEVACELRSRVEELQKGDSRSPPESNAGTMSQQVVILAERRSARMHSRGPQDKTTSSPRHTRPLSNVANIRPPGADINHLVYALRETCFDGTDWRSFTLSTGRLRDALGDGRPSAQLPSARAEELRQALRRTLASAKDSSATSDSVRKACAAAEQLRSWLLDILTGSGV